METVLLLEEHEFPQELQKYFEGTKTWFGIDYLPKMSKVISYAPEFASTHGRCSRRAMVDGEAKSTTVPVRPWCLLNSASRPIQT